MVNRRCTTMKLVKEKQGGLIPTDPKRWPFTLIKHFADTTCVLPSTAGPVGRCPLTIFVESFQLKFLATKSLDHNSYQCSKQ